MYRAGVTDMMALVPLPAGGDAVERSAYAFDLVEAWLFRPPVASLLGAFGHQLPPRWSGKVDLENSDRWLPLNEYLPSWIGPVLDNPIAGADGLTPEQVDTLRRMLVVEEMAADDFNFRKRDNTAYVERAHAVTADFDDAFRDEVLECTRELGLVDPRPPRHARYDTTLVLGGGYRSPLLRARYAARLQERGIGLGRLSFLGSPRFMMDDAERDAAATYAPGATDEFDLLVGAARGEFGFAAATTVFMCGCHAADQTCPSWPYADMDGADATPPEYTHERRVDLADASGSPRGWALSACTSRPPYRPDTSDAFGLWARCFQPHAGQRVLVVTTQVFVPFQSFDSVRRLYLPYGIDIDVVGFGADQNDRPQTAEYLLQETLSAIRSARRLLVGAAEALMRRP